MILYKHNLNDLTNKKSKNSYDISLHLIKGNTVGNKCGTSIRAQYGRIEKQEGTMHCRQWAEKL